MLLPKNMYGKPKRCRHCDKIFRVGGGPVPTEAELAAFEAQAAKAVEPIADVIPVADDRRPRRSPERIVDVLPVADDRAAEPYRPAKGGTPAWLIVLSVLLVLAGLGVGGFFVWKAISERDSQTRSDDSKKDKKDKNEGGRDNPDDGKPPVGKPTVTRENLDRLQKGMPQDTVVAMLGNPTRIEGNRHVWQNGTDSIEVTFLRNQVDSFRGKVGNYAKAAGPSAPSRLTADNFRRLQVGLDISSIVPILGAPTRSTSGFGPHPRTGMRTVIQDSTWTEGVNSIQLKFVAGKLFSGTATIDGMVLTLGG
jgi:hypothetical protein